MNTLMMIVLYTGALAAGLIVVASVRSQKKRQTFLLIASYVLYAAWSLWFAPLLLFSTAVNFVIGSRLRKRASLPVLWLGIVFNLLFLAFFKYLPGLWLSSPVPWLRSFSHVAIPLGISFWTFQAMSYLFDLYRDEDLDPSFWEFMLYMAFFPIAISGPICRLVDMLPQFRSEEPVRWENVGTGIRRIATGALMMQLAQLLGRGILTGSGVNAGFDHAGQLTGPDVLCLVFGYGLQLFFDFAGYSHIAIGGAQILGYTLPENFSRPFTATTPSSFWTRWHMSLSFWIRDYVFLPMATARREMWWRNLSLLISMVLFGFWHKASLLFVMWGAYHGLLLVFHRQVQQFNRRFDWQPPTFLSWLATVTFINVGWIFFRANSLAQARDLFRALVSVGSYGHHFLPAMFYGTVAGLAAGYGAVLLATSYLDRRGERLSSSGSSLRTDVVDLILHDRWVWLTPLYSVLTLVVFWALTHARASGSSPFMYRLF
jgi:alginate O-acetyltransferase complex protein AlgI